jgi:hypothetical protein
MPAGVTHAVLFQLGVSGESTEANRAMLDRVLSDAQAQTEALRAEQSRLSENSRLVFEQFEVGAREQVGQLQAAGDARLKDLGDYTVEAKKRFEELLTKTEEERVKLLKTYDEHLALAKAVDYWGKRQRQHMWRALGFGLATAVVAGIGGWRSFVFAGTLFRDQPDKPHLWEVVAVLFVVTLVLWFVRILARVCVGNLHLELDAGERRVMVQTYLALLRDSEKGLPQEARALVLGPLFRRSSAGLVKDEGGPSNILDAAVRLLSGKP